MGQLPAFKTKSKGYTGHTAGVQDLAIQAYLAQRSPASLRRAVQSQSATIEKAIRSFAGNYNSPVIKRKAQILAARAIQSYDPSKGTQLSTHIYTNLQPLRRLAPQVVEPLKIPEAFSLDQKAVAQAEQDFLDSTGRDPTDVEIADLTGISVKRLKKMRAATIPMSANALSAVDESGEVNTLSPGVVNPETEDIIDLVYHDLSPSDKKVFEHRVGYNGNPQLENDLIAAKLSRDTKWVSQRANKIQERINNALGRS